MDDSGDCVEFLGAWRVRGRAEKLDRPGNNTFLIKFL
jgi:hypothetical protein